jgi:hypothetical protein
VVGFVMGVGSRLLRDAVHGPIHYEAIASLAVLVILSASLAASHRGARTSIWLYELEAFSLWAAFLSGWSLVHGGVWSDALVAFGAWWLGAAVVGAFIVAARARSAT